MSDTDNDRFLHKLKQTLDDSVDTLDDDISKRLTQARQHTLASVSARDTDRTERNFLAWGWLLKNNRISLAGWSAISVACALLITITAYFTIAKNDFNSIDFGAIEILTDKESLDLYDDLAFYEWLAKDRDRNAG